MTRERRTTFRLISAVVFSVGIVLLAGGTSFLARPVGAMYMVLWIMKTILLAISRDTGVCSVYEGKERILMIIVGLAVLSVVVGAPWEYAHLEGPLPKDGSLAWGGLALFATGIGVQATAFRELGSFYTRRLGIQQGHRLVTTGPYGVVRHPGYLSEIMAFFGMGIAMGSTIGVAAAAACVPLIILRIRDEEEMLENTFGEEYRSYKRRTKALVPFVY